MVTPSLSNSKKEHITSSSGSICAFLLLGVAAIVLFYLVRGYGLERQCSDAIDRLVDLNINFLALDFDLTVIDTHTGGYWEGTTAELAQHMRPMFIHLVPMATQRNIRIAVVTFSPQTKQIREVLEYTFGREVSELIPIRGNDKTWNYEDEDMYLGKREHMASVVQELMTDQKLGVTDIRKETTLLIDDDLSNVKQSLRDGTMAIWLNPSEPDRLLDYIRLLKKRSTERS